MRTSWSGREYGKGLSSTPSTALKIAVFAPIPMASVRIAAIAKPGAERSVLSAKCKSCPRSASGRLLSSLGPPEFELRRAVPDIADLPDRIIRFDARSVQRVGSGLREGGTPLHGLQ